MKKIFVVGLYFCFAAFQISVSAQEFQTVENGVEYVKLVRKIEDEPIVVNLLRLDLSKVRLDVVHAADAAIGTETTSSIAARRGALAAINAGFFRLDRSVFAGDAAGVLQIDGELLSESVNDRIALFIVNERRRTEVGFAHLNVKGSLRIGKKYFQFSGINRQRKGDELIEFTSNFHPTTLTDANGLEIVVRGGKIAEINDGKGNSRIPRGGFVVSASGKMRAQILPFVKIGRKVKFESAVRLETKDGFTKDESDKIAAVLNAEDITNGVPQLIKNGVIAITWEQEKSGKAFVETRHPRTAVAKLKNGKFLLATIDGRQPGISVGMSLHELAEFLLEMGATDAMNLDGGGSTTMFLGGKIVNQPSDKEGERKVGDAILVFPRRKK